MSGTSFKVFSLLKCRRCPGSSLDLHLLKQKTGSNAVGILNTLIHRVRIELILCQVLGGIIKLETMKHRCSLVRVTDTWYSQLFPPLPVSGFTLLLV